jgi:hypothetical protein
LFSISSRSVLLRDVCGSLFRFLGAFNYVDDNFK